MEEKNGRVTDVSEERETEQDGGGQAGGRERAEVADESVEAVSPTGGGVTEEEGKLPCSREELVGEQARDSGL